MQGPSSDSPHPPLLSSPIALTVTRLATTMRLTIRCLSLISEAALETTKFSTSTGLDISRKAIEVALRTARDLRRGLTRDPSRIGNEASFNSLLDHYTHLGIYLVHHAFTMAELLSLTSLQLASQSIRFSLQLAEETVSLFDGLFGSTETSRAVAAIVRLTKQEVRYVLSEDGEGEAEAGMLKSLAGITKSVTAYACLQTKTKARKLSQIQLSHVAACTIPLSQVRVHAVWDDEGVLASSRDDPVGDGDPLKNEDYFSDIFHDGTADDGAVEEPQTPDLRSPFSSGGQQKRNPQPETPQGNTNQRFMKDLEQLAATAAIAAGSACQASEELGEKADTESFTKTIASISRRSGASVSEMVMHIQHRAPGILVEDEEEGLVGGTLRRTESTLTLKIKQQEDSVQSSCVSRAWDCLPKSPLSTASPYQPTASTTCSLFPEGPLTRTLSRYVRFANGAYGKQFMRILGIGTHSSHVDGHPNHHPNHYAFAHHTGIDVSDVIFSSFQRVFVLKRPGMEAEIIKERAYGSEEGVSEKAETVSARTTAAADITGRSGWPSSLCSSQSTPVTPTPPKLVGHLSPSSLLHRFSFNTPGIHPVIHYLSVDHKSSTLILTLRGTLGLSDLLVDLTCAYTTVEFYATPPLSDGGWNREKDSRIKRKFRVHDGIYKSAKLLEREIRQAVAMALDFFQGYGLVMTGHSLGGGVAAMLALMWSDLMNDDPCIFSDYGNVQVIDNTPLHKTSQTSALPPGRPIHCYTYGCPCVVDPGLSKYLEGAVTSVVHRDDIVPTLSLGLVKDLKSLTRTMMDDSNKGVAESVIARVLGLDRLCEYDRAPFQHLDTTALSPRSSASYFHGSRHPGTPGTGATYRPEEEDYFWSVLSTLSAGLTAEKLSPPGRVYWVLASTLTCLPEESSRREPLIKSVNMVIGWLGFGGYNLPDARERPHGKPKDDGDKDSNSSGMVSRASSISAAPVTLATAQSLPGSAQRSESWLSRAVRYVAPWRSPSTSSMIPSNTAEPDQRVDIPPLSLAPCRRRPATRSPSMPTALGTSGTTRKAPKQPAADAPGYPGLPTTSSTFEQAASPIEKSIDTNASAQAPRTSSSIRNRERNYLRVSLHRVHEPSAVFGELRFSKTMLSDHSPKYYEDALRALDKGTESLSSVYPLTTFPGAPAVVPSQETKSRTTEREYRWDW